MLSRILSVIRGFDFNTLILLLILMMMFGEYSQRYFHKANWGTQWNMEAIAPFIYYASGVVAIILCVLLAIRVIMGLVKIIGG